MKRRRLSSLFGSGGGDTSNPNDVFQQQFASQGLDTGGRGRGRGGRGRGRGGTRGSSPDTNGSESVAKKYRFTTQKTVIYLSATLDDMMNDGVPTKIDTPIGVGENSSASSQSESDDVPITTSLLNTQDRFRDAPVLVNLTPDQVLKVMGHDQGLHGCFGCKNVGERHPSISGTNLGALITLLEDFNTANIDQQAVHISHFYKVAIQGPANERALPGQVLLPEWTPTTIKNHLLYHNGHSGIFKLICASKSKNLITYILDKMVLKKKITCEVVLPESKIGIYGPTRTDIDMLGQFLLPPSVDLSQLLINEMYKNEKSSTIISRSLLRTFNRGLPLDYDNITARELVELCDGVATLNSEIVIIKTAVKSAKDLSAMYLSLSKLDSGGRGGIGGNQEFSVASSSIDVERKRITTETMFGWENFFIQDAGDKRIEASEDGDNSGRAVVTYRNSRGTGRRGESGRGVQRSEMAVLRTTTTTETTHVNRERTQ